MQTRAGIRGIVCRIRPPFWASVIVLLAFDQPPAAAQEEQPADARSRIITRAREALVQVELFLKTPTDHDRDAPPGAGETVSTQLQERQQEQMTRDKKAIDLMGVILAPREILVPDTGIDPRRIDRWEVLDPVGRPTEARASAMFRDAPTLVLEPVDPQISWTAPATDEAAIDAGTPLVLVAPQRLSSDWVLSTSAVRTVRRWGPELAGAADSEPFWIVGSANFGGATAEALLGGAPRPTALNLVFNTQAQLLGVGLADRIYAGGAAPPWRWSDLRTATRISRAEWESLQQNTTRRFGPFLYPVRIEYRRPRGGTQASPDSELLGWAISDRLLLIPHAMPRTTAAQIERVTIEKDGQEFDGRFLGQFNDMDACLIALDADTLASHWDLTQSAKVLPYRMYVVLTFNRRYGDDDLRVDYTRALGSNRVYGNHWQPQLVPSPSLGSLVLDLDGNVIGLFARRRRPLEELEPYEGGLASIMRLVQQSSSVELFELADWAEVRANPSSRLDPRVVQRDEKDQDRRVWLGVEFNPLSRELAENLGCRKESKDGSVGLMISQIYAGSPAERIGLRTGDVLLRVELAGRPRPIELSPVIFQTLERMPRPRGGMGFQGGAQAPWPSRNNGLTSLLAIIGAGAEVKIDFWHEGKLEHAVAQLEQAPPDQDSAEQYRDESLGITVKEATYEVRAALRMRPDDPGLVVAKVEPGTAAARARIAAFEIVQSADGQPLASPAELEAIVNKAKETKKDQIRLVILDRGRSRFADLKLQ